MPDSLAYCSLTWAGETRLLKTNLPFLVPALAREAGPFFHPAIAADFFQDVLGGFKSALHLTVTQVGDEPVPHEERFSATVHPTEGWVQVTLIGPFSPDEAVLVVVSYAALLLRYRLLAQHGQVLHVHAAAVVHDGKALLLLGPSGAGKTTLTARFVQAGWSYLSDEDALVAGGRVFPIPRALRMSPWSADRLGLQGLTEPYVGFFGERGVRWLCPERAAPEAVPLVGVLVLQPGQGGALWIGALDLAQRLIELLDQTHRENRDGDRARPEIYQATLDYNRQLLPALEQMIAQVPVQGLFYNLERDLDAIPSFVQSWWHHE